MLLCVPFILLKLRIMKVKENTCLYIIAVLIVVSACQNERKQTEAELSNEISLSVSFSDKLLKEAQNGDANAQYKMGLYCESKGELRYQSAAKWYRAAAVQGHKIAAYKLGVCYFYGRGVTQNYNEAFKLYQYAANEGCAEAQNDLGVCYEKGYGVSESAEIAFKWYSQAAEQGYPISQYLVGCYYERGCVVSQDYKEAIEWYKKAAKYNVADAEYNLAICYAKGRGVDVDMNKAIEWCKKAASHGSSEAIEILQKMEN